MTKIPQKEYAHVRIIYALDLAFSLTLAIYELPLEKEVIHNINNMLKNKKFIRLYFIEELLGINFFVTYLKKLFPKKNFSSNIII